VYLVVSPQFPHRRPPDIAAAVLIIVQQCDCSFSPRQIGGEWRAHHLFQRERFLIIRHWNQNQQANATHSA